MANTGNVDDNTLSCWFADGYGPAGAGGGNPTLLGHGFFRSGEKSSDQKTGPTELSNRDSSRARCWCSAGLSHWHYTLAVASIQKRGQSAKDHRSRRSGINGVV